MRKNPLLVILGISAFFFVVFVAVAVGTVMSLTSERPSAQSKLFGKSNLIGIIELKGVIIESKAVLEQIDKLEEDSMIKGVVVRINSPGGAVGPSQEIYAALLKLSKKKPVYSSMGSLAASGGYYAACGTKRIFANPGTLTGSIGVIMQFADLSKLYQWAKVNPYVIKTGRFKDVGSPSREMGPEEKALMQELIDNVLGQFRRAVVAARGLPMEKVVELSDGRIFSGEQAKSVKLVDELGGFNEAVEAIAKEVGIAGKPKLVYPGKGRQKFIDFVMRDLEGAPDDEGSSSFSGTGSGAARDLALRLVGRWLGLGAEVTGFGANGGAPLMGPLFILPQALGN